MKIISKALRLFRRKRKTAKVVQVDFGSSKPKSLKAIKAGLARQVITNAETKNVVISYLKKAGNKGLSDKNLNEAVCNEILDHSIYADQVSRMKNVRAYLYKIKSDLREHELIYFSHKKWIHKKTESALSEKETRFLYVMGLKPDDFVRVPNKQFIIDWIYKTFTDAEFEQFCCALLQHIDGRNVRVTEKRKSGADGGFDGQGFYVLSEGEEVPFIFEAKQYNPKSQVGDDICKKLFATMAEKEIKHGVIITTAQMSKRSYAFAKDTVRTKFNMDMDFIDQDKMVEIMTYREETPHGLGIFKSDFGFYYMNKALIKQAAGHRE